jgi:hypothetical protein
MWRPANSIARFISPVVIPAEAAIHPHASTSHFVASARRRRDEQLPSRFSPPPSFRRRPESSPDLSTSHSVDRARPLGQSRLARPRYGYTGYLGSRPASPRCTCNDRCATANGWLHDLIRSTSVAISLRTSPGPHQRFKRRGEFGCCSDVTAPRVLRLTAISKALRMVVMVSGARRSSRRRGVSEIARLVF